MTKPKKISVWTETTGEGTAAALPRFGKTGTMEVVKVDTDVLTTNLQAFLRGFNSIIATSQHEAVSGYHIDEIELDLSVNAEGGIELVGKLTAGAQAGIKIKLKRNST